VPGASSENAEIVVGARRLLQYASPLRSRPPVPEGPDSPVYRATPLKPETHALMASPRKAARVIPKTPVKVLDAPDLQVHTHARTARSRARTRGLTGGREGAGRLLPESGGLVGD
jgi:hypothetical protein